MSQFDTALKQLPLIGSLSHALLLGIIDHCYNINVEHMRVTPRRNIIVYCHRQKYRNPAWPPSPTQKSLDSPILDIHPLPKLILYCTCICICICMIGKIF